VPRFVGAVVGRGPNHGTLPRDGGTRVRARGAERDENGLGNKG